MSDSENKFKEGSKKTIKISSETSNKTQIDGFPVMKY
jgi:hypothetical protein